MLTTLGYSSNSKPLLATVFLCLLLLFPHPAKTDDPALLAKVPFELVNNRIQLSLFVGDQELRFLMDTGASRTVLFQSETHSFDEFAAVKETYVAFPALDRIINGTTLAPVPIWLGDHIFEAEAPLLIKRQSPVGDRLSLKFDGILGQDFYNKYVVEVNPKTKLLSLYKLGTKIKRAFRTRLHLHMKGNAPHIRVVSKFPWERRAKTKELLIDTGYPGSMVIWNKRHFRQAAGSGQADELQEANIGIFTRATFEIGNLRFVDAPIFIAANEPVQASRRDGLLGSNVLSQFHHVIDFRARRLWLSVVGVHRAGVDGGLYLPNNEDYIIRNFSRPQASPVIILE